MQLDTRLWNDSPIWNQVVDGYFKQKPVYLQKGLLKVHRKGLHIQPGLEINLSHEGKAAYVVGKDIYMQSSRQLILFPGNVPHQVFPDETNPYTRSVICLNESVVNGELMSFVQSELQPGQTCVRYQLSMEAYAKLSGILQCLDVELKRQEPGWERMIMAQVLELSVLIQRSGKDHRVDQRNDGLSGVVGNVGSGGRFAAPKPDLVRDCCEYIEAHLSDELSLHKVAERFLVSPEHLTRSFRKEKGVSFYQYVLLLRVQASKEMLLLDAQKSMTEIAYSLGFSSSTLFSRTFRGLTGMTPSDYRRRHG
jgi:AraC-like DNA-binding protein